MSVSPPQPPSPEPSISAATLRSLTQLYPIANMAAMFSQNPTTEGPGYSFSDAPKASGELREHRFYP